MGKWNFHTWGKWSLRWVLWRTKSWAPTKVFLLQISWCKWINWWHFSKFRNGSHMFYVSGTVNLISLSLFRIILLDSLPNCSLVFWALQREAKHQMISIQQLVPAVHITDSRCGNKRRVDMSVLPKIRGGMGGRMTCTLCFLFLNPAHYFKSSSVHGCMCTCHPHALTHRHTL